MRKVILLAMAASVSAAAHAVVIFDNTAINTSFTTRSAGNAPAGRWTNTNGAAVNFTRVSFWGNFSQASNFKFMLANSAGTVLNTVVVNHTGTGLGLYGADVNWTVGAGQTFLIGAIHETGTVLYGFRTPVGTSQNGLTAMSNGNYTNYAAPVFGGFAGAEMSWKLEGGVVPEPATMAALGLGALALIRRKRSR